MTAQIKVVNAALQMLGANRIAALDASTKEAREAAEAWDDARDALLRGHPWNFAMTRRQVAASAVAPPFGYGLAYPLPADCLRVYDVPGLSWKAWTVESGDEYGAPLALLVNVEPAPNASTALNIRYIRRRDNVETWDVLARRALACELAMRLGETLTASNSKIEAAAAMRQDALREARRTNAIEKPPVEVPADDWLTVRE